MSSPTFRNALLAFFVYFLILNIGIGLLAVIEPSGVGGRGAAAFLLILIALIIASFWLARALVERFTGIRLGIPSVIWYVVGIPFLVVLFILLPLTVIIGIVFTSDNSFSFSVSAEENFPLYVLVTSISGLIIAAIDAFFVLRRKGGGNKPQPGQQPPSGQQPPPNEPPPSGEQPPPGQPPQAGA